MSHSRLAPSSAHRWVHCPGSVAMSEQFPEPQGNAAAEGEACHWIGSEVLSGRGAALGASAPNGVVLTDEMHDAAKVYVAAVHSQLAGRAAPAVCAVEQLVQIPRIHAECFGTADCSFTDDQIWELHIFDLKYGFGIVEPWDNWQMICYAAGLIQPHHKFVTIHIVQPRPFHADGPHRRWRVGVGILERYIEQLRMAAEAVFTNHAPVTSGSYCKYCSARHACPALQKTAMLCIDYTDRATPQVLSPDALSMELRTIQRAAEAIQYRLTGLEGQAAAAIRAGGTIPGFALESGVGKQKWTVPVEQLACMGDVMGFNLRKSIDTITPAQARKAGMPEDLVTAYTERLSGEVKLVASSMTRIAAVFGGG